jgi:hypothetical protein
MGQDVSPCVRRLLNIAGIDSERLSVAFLGLVSPDSV